MASMEEIKQDFAERFDTILEKLEQLERVFNYYDYGEKTKKVRAISAQVKELEFETLRDL